MTIAQALGYLFALATGVALGWVSCSRTRSAKVDAGILRVVCAEAKLAEAETRLVERIAREEQREQIDPLC